MSAPVSAEQAWQDLQRIRVPQERVYDEVEKRASGDPRATYAMTATVWVFLVAMGLDIPKWGLWLLLVGYFAAMGALVVAYSRRTRVQLHRSRYSWRSGATFVAGGVVSGGTVVLSGRLVDALALPYGSVIQATLWAATFLLFVGPANRWAVSPLRKRGARTLRERADR
ncbi:hypothetical protein ACWC2K_11845 [Streptomyces chattanoogensis]|uniref:hypothetical protein n=1 Tax=Streptomyces chattanoogensis TaxID=66876 RepID=UPI003695D69C